MGSCRAAAVAALASVLCVGALPVDEAAVAVAEVPADVVAIDPGPALVAPRPVDAPVPGAGDEGRAYVPPPVVVPPVGSADVVLDGPPSRAGDLPIMVGQPGPDAAAEAGAARTGRRRPGAATVEVTTLDQDAVEAIGARFLAFTLTSADLAGGDAAVEVDYSGFAHAFGGNFASRLQLVRFPACALESPGHRSCAPVVIDTDNDLEAATLSAAAVPVDEEPASGPTEGAGRPDAGGEPPPATATGGGAGVYALTSSPVSEAGSYTATPLAASQEWQVGLQSGAFNWSYPIPAPPAPVGPTPSLSLDYSSQAVDGLTAKSNTQAGITGVGWSVGGLGFIDRSYRSCSDDGWYAVDLCWFDDNGENATISLNGHADELVPTSDPDRWRLRRDPGWLVERRFGGSGANDDGDDEWWKVTTPDGYKYYFGIGIEIGTSPAVPTNSVFTVPVFGDDAGEPCHVANSNFSDDRCNQGWRWNLDRVQDPDGNITTVFYETESNWYGAELNNTPTRLYDRGGYPVKIEYSLTDGDQVAPAEVVFGYEDRCLSNLAGSASSCPWPAPANASDWPDVPIDMICGTTCPNHAPTFFLTKALTTITTRTYDGQYRNVDRVDLHYSYPAKLDGRDPMLWLNTFQRIGDPGGEHLEMPVVNPNGVDLDNHHAGYPRFTARRVNKIVDEYGTELQVTYGQPDGCAGPGSAWDQNRTNCFPVPYMRDGNGDPVFIVNRRYLVTGIVQRDLVNAAWPSQQWSYAYGDAHTTAVARWHDDADLVTPEDLQTWADWRGHSLVTVTFGSGSNVTTTEYRYFTGMHGDALAGAGTRSATLADARGGTVTDHDWFAGQVREIRKMSASTGLWFSDARHGYTAVEPVTPASGRWIKQVLETTTQTWTSNSSGVPVETRVETDYDAYGLPTAVFDLGRVGLAGDGRCTNYTYARNTTWPAWTTSLVATAVTTDQGPSGTSTTCAGTVVARTETYYDGHTSLTAAPTEGHVTMVKSFDTPTHAVTTTTGYDAHGRVTSVTDGLGRTTTTEYTPSDHRLVSSITETGPAPFGYETTRTLGARRQLVISESDHNGKVTVSDYDALGRLLSVRLPSEPAGTASYRYAYEPLDLSDPQHPRGWRVHGERLLASNGGTGTYVGSWTYYDGFARPREVQTASPSGAGRVVVTTTYDARGLVTRRAEPVGVTGAPGDGLANATANTETRATYDELERVVSTATWGRSGTAAPSLQWAATSVYDGFTRSDTTPEGRRRATTTDVRGQVVQVEELTSAGAVYSATSYRYTTRGELAEVEDDLGNLTTTTYDMLGRRTELVDPDMGTWTFAYDDNGNTVRTTDGLGGQVWVNYDELGRPVDRRSGSATGPLLASWTYMSAAPNRGMPADSTVYDGADAYTVSVTGYDARYRPTGKTVTVPASAGPGLAGTWTTTYDDYDAADNLRQVTYPAVSGVLAAEQVTTGYTPLGVPETLTGVMGGASTTYLAGTTYRADGKVAGRTLGTGAGAVTRAYTYDDATSRLAGITGTADGVTFQDDTFSYDDDGNVTRIDEAPNAGQAQCFTYDGQSRLEQAWTTTSATCTDFATPAAGGTAPYKFAYGYDAVGNLTSVTKGSHPARAYAYGAGSAGPHAVTSVTPGTGGSASDTYGYDANGAMTTRTVGGASATMTWTADHRLRTVTRGAQVTTSVVGPDGNRVLRREPNGTTTLYLEGQEVRRTGSGTISATRYYSAGGVTVGLRDSAGVSWYLSNYQASAAYTVTAGVPTVRRYLPFGAPRGPVALATSRGFLGHVEDSAAGLVDLGARFYDAELGRFISVDPLVVPTDPASLNPYSYSNNNPTSRSDPTGLVSFCLCGGASNPPPPPSAPRPSSVPRNAGYEPPTYSPPTPTRAATRRLIVRTVLDGATVAHWNNLELLEDGHEYDPVHGGWGGRADYTYEEHDGGWLSRVILFPLAVAAEPVLQAVDCVSNPSLGGCAWTAVDVAAAVAFPASRVARAAVRGPAASPVARAAASGVDDAYHYTSRQFVESIERHGLRRGTYATPTGNLSPLQAQLELALPPNRGLPDVTIRIDVAGLREAGYEIPRVARVPNVVRGPGGRVYSMPGGGWEMQFDYAIPPEFIKVVP